MPKIQYIEKRFSETSLLIIARANEIIDEYKAQGYDLTLRQLYYKFVARNLIENKQSEYKRLGGIVNDARLAGLIDWKSIIDRTRELRERPRWESPQEIIKECARQYHIDWWEGQQFRPEVWIEKDALIGVIEGVCKSLDVPYISCRGYISQSEMWRAGNRVLDKDEQESILLHLADHDPSGIDMTRDIIVRLEMFTRSQITVIRVALNMSQIEEHQPPPNPAKITDPRANGYVQEFGSDSWELDALEPQVLSGLIRDAVLQYQDVDILNEALRREEVDKKILQEISEEIGGE